MHHPSRPRDEELERLSLAFRPSWELEVPPFTGTVMADFDGDMRARTASSPAINGLGAPAPMFAIVPDTPEGQGGIAGLSDRPPSVAPVTAPRSAHDSDRPPFPPSPAENEGPLFLTPAARSRLSTIPPPGSLRPPKADGISLSVGSLAPKKRKTGLVVALGLVGVMAVGAVVVVASRADSAPAAPAAKEPITAAANTATTASAVSKVDPPPTATQTSVAPAPSDSEVAPIPAAAPKPTSGAARAPVGAAAPKPAVPAAAPKPAAPKPVAPPAHAKPAPKPTSGSNIVRDVPF